MSASFEIKLNEKKQFYFQYLNKQHELMMMSREYDDKTSAEQAIKDVRVGSLMGEQLAAGKVSNGDSFFVVKNTAGDILAKSILFNSQMVFDNAFHAMRDNACMAEIRDLTA